MNRKKNKIIILGGFTHENRGDLAMMDGIISHIKQEHPNTETILYSWNPPVSQKKFSIRCAKSPDIDMNPSWSSKSSRIVGLLRILIFIFRFTIYRFISYRLAKLISRTSTLAFFSNLIEARALVIHGSGSFNSIWWYDWLYPKTACCLAGLINGTPTLVTSQGIGPLDNLTDRIVARVFFKSARFIGVRDGDFSKSLILSLGASEDKVHHTGDDALLLNAPPTETVSNLFTAEGIPTNKLLLGVNFRDSSSYKNDHKEDGLDVLASALDFISEEKNAHIVFVPISYDSFDDDRKSSELVASHMKSKNYTIIKKAYTATTIRGIISNLDICIGTSYNFLLFSLSANKPTIGLYKNNYYEHKHKGLFTLFGQANQCYYTQELNANAIKTIISNAINNKESIGLAIKVENARSADAATKSRAIFDKLIDSVV